MESINIPENVSSIGVEGFSGCSSLTKLEVDNNNKNYASDDGILYNKDKTMLLCCMGRKTGNATIPERITDIKEGAFWGCGSLESISIPKSVTDIGMEAFADCSSLENINIPEKVAAIGSGAFFGCSSLKSITLKQRWY